MWLPLPIYERIPQFWLLLGLLLISSAAYLSFDYAPSFVYFGAGLFCCLNSLRIFTMRLEYRQKALQQTQDQAESTDQQNLTERDSSDDLYQTVEVGA